MKKTSLNNRIKAYGTIAMGIIGTSFVNGQVVYTDVNPDEVLVVTPGTAGAAAFAIDMDADGTDDFSIENRVYGTANDLVQANIMSASSNSLNLTIGTMGAYSTFGYATAVATGATIDASGSFNSGVMQMVLASVYNGTFYGNLGDAGEHYLGVMFGISGSNYFGWIRVSGIPQNGETVTIMDYAYESTTDAAILAGATTTSIASDLNQFDVAVYSNEKNINVVSDNDNVMVTVYDLTGQVVRSEKVQKGHSVLNMSDATSGIYMVSLENNGQIISRRINL